MVPLFCGKTQLYASIMHAEFKLYWRITCLEKRLRVRANTPTLMTHGFVLSFCQELNSNYQYTEVSPINR